MKQVQVKYGLQQHQSFDNGVLVQFVTTEQVQQADAQFVQPQVDQVLRNYVARGLFKAEHTQTLIVPTMGVIASQEVIFVGLSLDDQPLHRLREAGAAAAKEILKLRAAHVIQLLPAAIEACCAEASVSEVAQSLTEGYLLSLFKRQADRKNVQQHQVETITFVPTASLAQATRDNDWVAGIERGYITANAVNYARQMTNLPGNQLTPEKLAMEAEQLADDYSDLITIEIIDEWTASDLGMGGLLGVGQGSVHPPRMIVLHYEGNPGHPTTWGLIGKGITFDTGGISLKKAAGMEEMISDMAGAAAVLGTMQIVAQVKPAINVIAVIASAENMPSDRALKPGDVIKMMNGTTVEVINTDAEGRLVLGDALTTAIRRGATQLVDVATLTGAVMVAVGNLATGAIGNDNRLLQQVIAASERTGERIWPLPNYPEFRKQLNSDAADLKNTGTRFGGASTGGLFIGEFAEQLPWVHLDIGGSAWLEQARGWESKGATGVMVRTLAELLLQSEVN